jgi:myosin-5
VVYQPSKERNYHVFYQLVSGAPLAERKQFGLMGGPESFNYLNQGGPGSAQITGVDDSEDFAATERALSVVGISVRQQWEVFRILASILHLGNVRIVEGGVSQDSLQQSAKLLGLPADELSRWLRQRKIKMRSEEIIKDLTPAQSVAVRDSLAKFIYSILFDWLVGVVNLSLAVGSGGDQSAAIVKNFIGVLDIYGFEHFQRNSFEQLCINYANEKLQQEFNQHVFKLEQEEYVREGIEWSYIDFNDNQPCIDLIEGRLGVLDLLDEVCAISP